MKHANVIESYNILSNMYESMGIEVNKEEKVNLIEHLLLELAGDDQASIKNVDRLYTLSLKTYSVIQNVRREITQDVIAGNLSEKEYNAKIKAFDTKAKKVKDLIDEMGINYKPAKVTTLALYVLETVYGSAILTGILNIALTFIAPGTFLTLPLIAISAVALVVSKLLLIIIRKKAKSGIPPAMMDKIEHKLNLMIKGLNKAGIKTKPA